MIPTYKQTNSSMHKYLFHAGGQGVEVFRASPTLLLPNQLFYIKLQLWFSIRPHG